MIAFGQIKTYTTFITRMDPAFQVKFKDLCGVINNGMPRARKRKIIDLHEFRYEGGSPINSGFQITPVKSKGNIVQAIKLGPDYSICTIFAFTVILRASCNGLNEFITYLEKASFE